MNKSFSKPNTNDLTNVFESGKCAQAIRKGLIFMTPLVILSSMAQVALNFPVDSYQEWLLSPSAHFFYQVFFRLYCATLDCFSLILSFSVAWCYAEQLEVKSGKSFVSFGAAASFALLAGLGSGHFDSKYFGTAGISVSLLAALVTTKLFHMLSQLSLFQVRNEDADSFLSKMATSIFPLGIILVGTAVVSCLMDSLFHVCLPELIETFLTAVFLRLQINTSRIVTGIFYTVSLHLLWFFGIHGSHVFFEINEVFLKNLLHHNMEAAALNLPPVEIVNTVSLNVYCNIGGAGATLALVIAILLGSRGRGIRRIAKFAALPSLFNVNEILLFGLPIVFNPMLFLPFILAPALNLCIGYGATALGLVPVICSDIHWTTPPLFSGYMATGSISGALLQVFLILADVLVYLPFVKAMDNRNPLFKDLYEDDFEKIKTMEEKDTENRRLIHALSNMYEDVYEAHMETRTVRIIRTSLKNSHVAGEVEVPFERFREPLMETVSPEEQEELGSLLSSRNFSDKLLENNVQEREIKIKRDGAYRWIRVLFILSEVKNGKPSVITITSMDIDEMKKVKEEHDMALLSAYEAARQASMAKSDFLSSMSHDIRTPMNAILGMCTIARQHMDDRKRVEDCLDKINASSTHLLNLINAVLDMSKIESGKMIFHEHPFNLKQMLTEICDIIQPRAAQKKQEFCCDFNGLGNSNVIGDALRIRQIFVNILGNAVKFTPENGRITFEAHTCPSVYKDYTTLEFTCSDTGIGMDEEFKNKMFQPFVRDAKTEVREVEGNGLGMAIVKNIIDIMNGEIYVDSEVGKGTTFTIVLHLKDDKDTVSSPDPEQPWKQKDICNLEGRRILLVEDNELNREIAVEFLAMTGEEIEEAVNGKQAVERMEASPPHYYDLILMDIQMPEMNGCEAAKRIRKLEREDSDLPIIAMTANAFSDDIRMTKEAGMNEHISKPIDLPKLYQVLGRCL